jgi:N-acetylmuramoyl-L-alanine amidase
VNPAIATDAGKLHMTFNHDPIVPPGTETLTFNNQAISSAIYRDGNGAAEITIVGATPLFARFSTDHKTITITAAPLATAQGGALPSPTGGTAAPATQTRENSASQPYFAVVDASHGGEDRGAALTSQLAEKDITLAFAIRLREELQAHGLNTLLLRNGDTDLSADQRAGMTNAAHPAIYLCVHAASQGHGVNLYTALLPDDTEKHGLFWDWDTAQVSSLARSQFAAAILAKTLEDSKIQVRKLSAPLRPLNNITTAAVAVEIAPPAGGASGLSSVEYQQAMASSIANGVAAAREKMGNIP